MVGVVDCYNKEITLKALETTQSYIANCTHTVHDDDNSLNSSDQSRYSGIRNCSVLSPDVPRRRIIEPVSLTVASRFIPRLIAKDLPIV